MKTKKILSLGGGVDSFAMFLDAIDRNELPDLVIFADVGSPKGDDGEWPSTYRHVREVVMPICEEQGIEFKWLTTNDYPIRGEESLLAYFEKKNIMPTRRSRLCTNAAKVERICSYLIDHYGAEQLFEVWIGFEAGEENRAAQDPHAKEIGGIPQRINRFPLIERALCRCRCVELIQRHGYAVPRKSACMFCPFSSKGDFKTLSQELPEVFDRVARLEENCKTTKSGKRMTFADNAKKRDSGNGETCDSLREFAVKPYKARLMPCKVCGAKVRASKATGCDYLEEGTNVTTNLVKA